MFLLCPCLYNEMSHQTTLDNQRDYIFSPCSDPPSEPSASNPDPRQHQTTETSGPKVQEERSKDRTSDLVLPQPSVLTVSIKTPRTHPDNDNSDNHELTTNIKRIHDPLRQTHLRDTNTTSHIPALAEHTSAEHGQMDISLHQCDSSESVDFVMSHVLHDVEPPVRNTSLDVMNTERRPDHEADTLNISTVLTHASSKLHPLEMISNVMETDKNDGISETLHNTSVDNPVYTAVIHYVEPKETEAEPHRTDNSIADRTFETKFFMEISEGQPIAEPSTNSVMTDHYDTAEIPQIYSKDKIDLAQTNLWQAPDATGDLGDCTEETEGVSLKFTGTKRDGEICELWLDACQFLAGEEDGGSIFDEFGRSISPCPPEADPNQTKASGFLRGENIMTDQSVENWKPFTPIERWSSTDSWASALSDWFQTVSTYPEGSFTSTEPSSADPKLRMAIQDTTVEQRTSPDITNTGQTCVSLSLQESEDNETLDRRPAKSDNTNETLFKQGDNDSLSSQSESDRQQNEILENKMKLSELQAECESNTTEMNAAVDLNAGVCSAGDGLISTELWSVKAEVDSLVRGDDEEREGNSGAQKISDYTSDKKNQTSECVRSDADLHTHPPQFKGDVSSEVEHFKHTRGVKTEEKCVSCSFSKGDGSHESPNTEKPAERSDTISEFMSVAPLSTGNTVLHHGELKQAGADVPHQEIINDNDTKFKPTIESGQKSINNTDSSEDRFQTSSEPASCSGESDGVCMCDSRRQEYSNICNISKELSDLILLTGERFMVSEDKHVAYVTLDLDEPRDLSLSSFPNHVNSKTQNRSCVIQPKHNKTAYKTFKSSLDGQTRSKQKEKMADQQHLVHSSKKQEKDEFTSYTAGCEDCVATVIETVIITEKITPKSQGKKKRKQRRTAKPQTDPPAEVRNRTVQKNTNSKTENLEVKVVSNDLDKPASHLSTELDHASEMSTQKNMSVRSREESSGSIVAKMFQAHIPASLSMMESKMCSSDPQSICLSDTLNSDIKRRRIADDPPKTIRIKTRPQLPAVFLQAREDEDGSRRAHSELVMQKTTAPKEVVPCVVSEIQAEPVPADPQSISLWCRFSPVPPDATIKWTKKGTVLSESRKGRGEDERFTLTLLKASSKDLGLYKCSVTSSNESVSTSEYHLTSEVLMELVIPNHDLPAKLRAVEEDEENIQCTPLLFKEDFLSDQFFGEHQPASIVTEKVHFGEGMHRKAFRTTLRAGKLPRFSPGHPCVLKVHNTIGCGTENNEELIQKNYSLAVEECSVQNTAREYIKAYHSVAKTAESFGDVPEIIPIYLVHRPSHDVPYGTLEEELLGDFVKYSVKDGREMNLMHRDSEAGQKCCAFQHWVYTQTEGNLLVTDMQGVGMKLTDVGIATCKKGYKGFRGNCATSFIDQFKALHQCNRYCELLGLTSLQPKPKRTAPPKPTAPAATHPFSSVLDHKS